MEIHERIKKLRKHYLGLSQAEFGKKLGVSRSVINNIERNVLAKPEQKLSLMKLICKEFTVREDWLFRGIGDDPFVKPESFSIDKYMDDRGATALETSIVKAYFDLDQKLRCELIEHFLKSVSGGQAGEAAQETPPDTVEDAEAAYIKSRLDAAKKTARSALNTTEDADSRKENAANE